MPAFDHLALPAYFDDWDEFFLALAELTSRKSKDPSTKTGCVVVDQDKAVRTLGFNGFPRGLDDSPERYADRELKLELISHCDRNAVDSAARIGVSLLGCTMYLTDPPCNECAKSIAQAGIRKVVFPRDNQFETDPGRMGRWARKIAAAKVIFDEAGVEVVRWERVGR